MNDLSTKLELVRMIQELLSTHPGHILSFKLFDEGTNEDIVAEVIKYDPIEEQETLYQVNVSLTDTLFDFTVTPKPKESE